MADYDFGILRIIAEIAAIGTGQIAITPTNDSVAGVPVFGFKDASGNSRRCAVLDVAASFTDLTVTGDFEFSGDASVIQQTGMASAVSFSDILDNKDNIVTNTAVIAAQAIEIALNSAARYDAHYIWANPIEELADTETAYGPEQITNNRFTSNIDEWLAGSSAILSWETGDYLRVTYDGVTNPYAYNPLTVTTGETYHCTGRARSSGGGSPKFNLGSAETTWTGTTSTDWQEFEVTGAAGYTQPALQLLGASGYVEWDFVSARTVSTLATTDKKFCADASTGAVLYYHAVDKDKKWNDGLIQESDAADAVSGWTATPVDGTLYKPRGSNDFDLYKYVMGEVSGQKDDFHFRGAAVTTLPITAGTDTDTAYVYTDIIIPKGELISVKLEATATLRNGDGNTAAVWRWSNVAQDGTLTGSLNSEIDGITGTNGITSIVVFAQSDIDTGPPTLGGGKIEFRFRHSVDASTSETIIDWNFVATGMRHYDVGDYC